MRGRAIIPLVVGLGLGVLALKVFFNVLEKAKASPTATVSVVYAMANIEPTVEIQDNMVEMRQVTKEAVPDTCFRDKAEVVGRVASWPIPKGCPIGAMQLAPKGTPPGMAVKIAEGYRAVAVQIDESAGVAGWLKPGSRVDVVVMLSSLDRGSNQSISKVILQNVEVLAVGQDIGKASDTAAALTRSVTLSVTPADVPKLHLASTKGKLRLAMRNQRDFGVAKEEETTDNDLITDEQSTASQAKKSGFSLLSALFNAQAKVRPDQTDKEKQQVVPVKPTATPEAQPWTVEVYRGSTDTEAVQFERKANAWQRVEDPDAKGRSRPTASSPKSMPKPLLPSKSPTAAAGGQVESS